MKYDVIIAGAGPGGLRCGELLAENGVRVLILEKNRTVGKKVCAGGITWSGLLEQVPHALIERTFNHQTIATRFQNVKIRADHPIVATLDREKLGQQMLHSSLLAGADIRTSARIISVEQHGVSFIHEGKQKHAESDFIIGADGSTSLVRKYLGLPVVHCGVGIHYQIPFRTECMEWHFNPEQFGSGYSWIFPLTDTISAGVYSGSPSLRPRRLKHSLDTWLLTRKIGVRGVKPRAERISFDYRGYHFGNVLLVGDAAGLASPLTGEGIYPAFVSAEAVARYILTKDQEHKPLKKVVEKHRKHGLMLRLADKNKAIALFLSELSVLLLRMKLISFKTFEMA